MYTAIVYMTVLPNIWFQLENALLLYLAQNDCTYVYLCLVAFVKTGRQRIDLNEKLLSFFVVSTVDTEYTEDSDEKADSR